MPYILYPLRAAAQDNCHCHLSSSEDMGARTSGGRVLCAYPLFSEFTLASAARCAGVDGDFCWSQQRMLRISKKLFSYS